MSNCLICGSEYTPFVDFGNMPIANAFSSKEELIDGWMYFSASINQVIVCER